MTAKEIAEALLALKPKPLVLSALIDAADAMAQSEARKAICDADFHDGHATTHLRNVKKWRDLGDILRKEVK